MQQRLSGVDVEFSLAWLLQPLSVETFLDEIWAEDALPRHATLRRLLR